MKTPKITVTAVGDMLIYRQIDQKSAEFQALRDYISKADARFFNLETVLHRGGIWANQFNGGSAHFSDPKVLDTAKAYGFNMLSFANNHTFDYGYGGLESTLKALEETDFVHTGVGRNLDEAAAPVYLDAPGSRIALISITASYVNDAALAGKQSRRVIGRPGVNGLRLDEWVEMPEAYFTMMRDVAENSGVNAALAIARAEGYASGTDDTEVALSKQSIRYRLGEKLQYHAQCNQKDMERLSQAIYEAKTQADCILVSIHAHQAGGAEKEAVPAFLQDFAHYAIDQGAHAVIGHGPHLLRPLEIYKDRPIFYSLGDFVLHNESFAYGPEDFYEKHGLTSDAPLSDVYRKRSRNYTCGLLTDDRMMESVIPYFEMVDGKLTKLELLPISLGIGEPRYRIGDPRIDTSRSILQRLQQISEPYGTKITVNADGLGIVELG